MGLLYKIVESLQMQAEKEAADLKESDGMESSARPESLIELLIRPVGSIQKPSGITSRRIGSRMKARRADR